VLSDSIRILNFDDSVVKQKALLSRYKTEIADLRNLASAARLWLDRKTEEELSSRLNGFPKNSVTFLGSGDFHHVSHILLRQFREPVCVIDFDLHPDWDILPPRLACGSWVSRALENKNVLKFVLLGVSSSDISFPSIQTGNLSALKDGRLEIYPYSHEPSAVFLRGIPRNLSIRAERGFLRTLIYWSELKGRDLKDLFLGLLRCLPVKEVYLTIDKDCLKKEYAVTNWEEGMLSLDELLLMLRLLKENTDIVGADICGDYSKVSIEGKVKKFFSDLDHPKGIQAAGLSDDTITAVNEETNLRILEAIR
jgi:hypothetical protein